MVSLVSGIAWCERCKVPLLHENCKICGEQGRRVASDIRPVFPQEQRLLEVLLDRPEGYFKGKSVWDTNSNRLLVDGKALTLNKGEMMKKDVTEIRKLLDDVLTTEADENANDYWLDTFARANRERLTDLDYSAFEIIRDARKRAYQEDGLGQPLHVVSFSGGKDSTVVFDLVRRQYANGEDLLCVFGNTTLEIQETMEYLERFKAANTKLPVREAKSNQDFFDLCERIGPPSRVMRWCCTIFKTGPIDKVYGRLTFNSNRSGQVLTYYGIRRSESTRRSKYEAISQSPKVARQLVVSPVIDWSDADVWLYIIANELDFNSAYKLGFSRVGCWCCPANSLWSGYLARIYFPEMAEPWRNFLVSFAKKVGKPDAEEYIDSGKWKARQGGQGLDNARRGVISSRPCGDDPDAKTYSLVRPISEGLYEYFRPFGTVNRSLGRSILGEAFVIHAATQEPLLLLQGAIGSSELRVKVINSSNPSLLLKRVDCQIRKFQSCELCTGCVAICPSGAIHNSPDNPQLPYRINSEKCTHCLKCVTHFDTGCLVSKVLKTKRGAIV